MVLNKSAIMMVSVPLTVVTIERGNKGDEEGRASRVS